jgi:hypothetical protein
VNAVNDAMQNWALAVANFQQQQQKQQQQQHLQQQQLQQVCEAKKSQDQANAKTHALQLKENLDQANATANALQLKENYERYLKTQAIGMDRRIAENAASRGPVAHKDPIGLPNTINVKVGKPTKRAAPTTVASGAAKKPRTEEDQAAGTILLGFLSSLRESYEDALVDKQKLSNGLGSIMPSRKSVESNSSSADDSVGSGGCDGPTDFFKQKRRAVPVTDSSSGTSQQVESSVDDSDCNSNLKTDPSSSEDSDKEASRHRSKGPLRKRMKLKKLADERRASLKL